ncbi:FadR/GntR family transcriptional regulator [Thermomonas sp.]|uniref:FadR/GntR family transcriptional regulator n=1 Tax=Thermomonas sp. TaxID=1971895 RepID=UPI002488B5FF|nr:FadR/GntR family transcriptional regulator [Thermomonas sp.]MDI1251582.1 FadR/GntR family transcriptional regulator [Thermomonas sp.]
MTSLPTVSTGESRDLGIAPIERVSIAEKVAKHLLDLIRTGNLEPGQQLPPERDLAASLQVSRPSVREALRGLQILGVIKTRQGGGIFVSSLDATDLLQPLQVYLTLSGENFEALHEARLEVEAGLGRLLTGRISDVAIERLDAMVQAQRKLVNDPVAFRISDMEFHHTLRVAVANPFLERVSASLYVLGTEYRRVRWETPGMLQQSLSDHQEIVDALAARDSTRVVSAMERHMHSVHNSTRQVMNVELPEKENQ